MTDYTHFVKSKSGFYNDLDKMLASEADCERLPDWEKHFVLVMDEMKVKESPVYKKYSLEIVGITDIHVGEADNQVG